MAGSRARLLVAALTVAAAPQLKEPPRYAPGAPQIRGTRRAECLAEDGARSPSSRGPAGRRACRWRTLRANDREAGGVWNARLLHP